MDSHGLDWGKGIYHTFQNLIFRVLMYPIENRLLSVSIRGFNKWPRILGLDAFRKFSRN